MTGEALKLKDFYHEELRLLRQEGRQFADAHPATAQALAMSHGHSGDPHVELLLQSFAFLTGRLHYQLESDRAALPNTLLAALYPHLEAPIPSMAVAQVAMKPGGPFTLERHRLFQTQAKSSEGYTTPCRMRTCWQTTLLPLEVASLHLRKAASLEFLLGHPEVFSTLQVQVTRIPGSNDPIQALGAPTLRLHIDTRAPAAFTLYNLLMVNLSGIAVRIGAQTTFLPPETLRWVGFEADEGALPERDATHPGYRLLQEYFAFPAKFLFFDLEGIDLGGAIEDFELFFLFDTNATFKANRSLLRLNCVPLVNLFPQPIDPLILDQKSYEYRLTGDVARHRYCEIYALERLTATRPGGRPREVVPFFAMEGFDRLEERDTFYGWRREESHLPQVAGSEFYISFMDRQFDLDLPADAVIGGRALCTNRNLPEWLRAGDTFKLEGPGAVVGATLLDTPTPHRHPTQLGARPWRLVTQLGLNLQNLDLENLKRMLRLHAGEDREKGWKQIEGLEGLTLTPAMRLIEQQPWRGFRRGLAVELQVIEKRFEGGSPLLFGAVLTHFLALLAHLNTFVEVGLRSDRHEGVWKRWPVRCGDQPLI